MLRCAGGLQPCIWTAQARVCPSGKCSGRYKQSSAVPPGSAHCPLATDGEHRPYLISGTRAGQLPSENTDVGRHLSRGDRGFNGPGLLSFQGPCTPAAARPWHLAVSLLCLPVCPSSPAKTGRPIINLFPFPLAPPSLCTHSRPYRVHTAHRYLGIGQIGP